MKNDLPLSSREIRWRRRHVPALHPRSYQQTRLTSPSVKAALPPGPHGFDVSSYQPAAPNFRQDGRQFAIFKATESTSYFDPHFNANRNAAHNQGCTAVGLYHFARPGSTSPDAQAQWFLGHVGPRQPGEFAVLDYEVPPWSEGWIVRYVQLLQQAGWNVAFYTYAGMASANPTGLVRAATPFYWPAGYSSNPPSADKWADVGWTLWQHTDGQYGVADGPWDCSVGAPGLLALAQGGSAPAPPSPTQEEPVGAYACPVIEPGKGYTHRPPPAEHSGGIPFGAVFVSFGADFGDPAIRPDAPVPLRIAYWDKGVNGWVVPFGGGSFNASDQWVEDNPQLPPLYVPTGGDVVALRFHASMTKLSIVHCGRLGNVVPLVEYVAG